MNNFEIIENNIQKINSFYYKLKEFIKQNNNNNNNNKKYLIEKFKNVNIILYTEILQSEDYLKQLKLNNIEKLYLLNLLIKYNINTLADYLKETFYIEIIYTYNINSICNIFNIFDFDIYIHKYLYIKIYDVSQQKQLTFDNIINNIINISSSKSSKIISEFENELKKINEFIDKNDFINKINNIKINFNVNYNKNNNQFNKQYINKLYNYTLSNTKFYDNDFKFNTYQCYFKAGINFFINNKIFRNQFTVENINRNIKNNENNFVKIQLNNYNYFISQNADDNINENSEIINTEFTGGNNETNEIYNAFINIIINKKDNNNFNDNYYKLQNYLNFKKVINKYTNDKYLLSIPGVKIYPFYVIQDILNLLKDDFSNDCIIEFKNNDKSYIYDCNKNYFLHDLILLNNSKIDFKNFKDYLDITTLKNKNNFNINSKIYKHFDKKEYNKYYYKNTITNYIKNIKNYPLYLLIACPIHDITSIYIINNKIKLFKLNYEQLKNIVKFIKEKYEIRIKYPYEIKLFHKDENNQILTYNYKLHSFIIVVNNETLDDHFIYYKVDYINNGLIRYDTNKLRINENNLEKYPDYIKNEYKTLMKNNYNENNYGFIKDNLSYKVVFCDYQLININYKK